MDINQFQKLIKSHERELSQYISRKLPVKVGVKVKSIVQENFRLGGFQNRGLEKWQTTKRQQRGGTSAAANYGPLLSSRQVLYRGTGYTPGNAQVTIYNRTAYAAIHNEGGTLHPRITPAMRKFAWHKYYELSGDKGKDKGSKSGEAAMWKGLALTKKKTLNIKIPKRQFLGPSEKVNGTIITMINSDLITILNS